MEFLLSTGSLTHLLNILLFAQDIMDFLVQSKEGHQLGKANKKNISIVAYIRF